MKAQSLSMTDESMARVAAAVERLRALPLGNKHQLELDEIEDQTRALHVALEQAKKERDELRQIVRSA